MRRRLLSSLGIKATLISQLDTQAGDVVFCNPDNDVKVYYRLDDGEDIIPKSYVPIGIVVIPASENLYGNYACGVMSLKNMNCDDPQNGSLDEQTMCWGSIGVNTDVSNMPYIPLVGYNENHGDVNSTIVGVARNAYFPSKANSAIQCPHDTNAFYYYESNDNIAPSPYLTSGNTNPAFVQIASPSNELNVLTEYDGKLNTVRILNARGIKDYNTWKPGRDIASDYPGASCCDMYYTPGTLQGDWYLPSFHEVIKMVYFRPEIDNTLTTLNQHFENICIPNLVVKGQIPHRLTSNESGINTFHFLDCYVNGSGEFSKDDSNTFLAIAFTRIGALERNYGDIYISGGNVTDVPANGGSSQVIGYTYSQTYGYGDSTTNGGVITSGAEISITSVSGENLGNTEKERTKVGESVITVSMNGKTATKSYDVYQQANVKNSSVRLEPYQPDSSWIVSVTNGNWDTCPASGGYVKCRGYVIDSYTSGSINESKVTDDASLTWSDSSWLQAHVNGGYNIHSRGTSTGDTRSITATWTYNGMTSAAKTLTQQANSRWETSRSGGSYSYGNVSAGSITNGWIGAGGGTGTGYAGNGSQSWSRTAITTNYSYTSGATSSAVTTAASSGTNTVAPSASSYTASANSKGTTVSGVTTVGSKYITWSANGKSTGGTIYVQQAANAVTSRTWLNGTPQFNVQTTISNLSGSYQLTGNGDCAAGNQHQIKCKYSTTCSFTITFKALAKGTFTSGSTGPVELTSYNQSIQSDASIGLTVTGSYPTYNCTLSRLNEGKNFSLNVFYASICFSNACSSNYMLKIYRNKY